MARKTVLKNTRTTVPLPSTPVDTEPEPETPDVEVTPETDAPEEPAPFEPNEAAELDLDTDPETSLVGSLYLHLLGEHNCYDALRLDDDDAVTMHDDLHSHGDYPHEAGDLRFRPARAMAASIRVPADTSAPPA